MELEKEPETTLMMEVVKEQLEKRSKSISREKEMPKRKSISEQKLPKTWKRITQ